MNRIVLFAGILAACYYTNAQVGIGTVLPTTDLEVVARTGLIPNEYNGLTIPKVAVLPTAPGEIAPEGTLIYLTAVSGSSPIGFYYSTGTAYVNVASAASGAFNTVGTTTPPTTAAQNVFRLGTTSFGEDVSGAQLNVTSPATAISPSTTALFTNANTSSTGNNAGVDIQNSSATNARKSGLESTVTGAGNGEHYGIRSIVTPASVANVNGYGIFSRVNSNSIANTSNFGIYSEIGIATSRGLKYGVYSYAQNDGNEASYSGYFRGDLFAIRSEDDATGYTLPVATGALGQVLTSDGAGAVSWQPVTTTSGSPVFRDSGTVTNATLSSTSVFRTGRTRFGFDSSAAAVVSIENIAAASGETNVLNVINRNTSTAAGTNTEAISTSNTSNAGGTKTGISNSVGSTGTGAHIGIDNVVAVNASPTNSSFGIRSTIGSTTSPGAIYGIYSEAMGSAVTNVYAGLFNGKLGVGNIARTTGYDFPTNRGTTGQVLTTDGAGITTWSAIPSAIDGSISNEGSLSVSSGTNAANIVSNTSGSTAVTIAGGNGINVTSSGSTITVAQPATNNTTYRVESLNGGPSGFATAITDGYYINLTPTAGNVEFILPNAALAAVRGRSYILRNISTTETAQIYSFGGTFFAGNSTASSGVVNMLASGNTKGLIFISDGTNWTYAPFGF